MIIILKNKGKIILFVLFGLSLNSAYSQNKKEQIEAMNFSIDSLKTIVNANNIVLNERNIDISNYKIEIVKLNSNISQLNSEISNAKDLLSNKDLELQSRLKELNLLKRNLQQMRDSLANAQSNQKLEILIWELTDVTWNQLEFDLKLLLPTTKFESPFNNVLISKDKKIKIFFEYNITDWMDQDEGNAIFYKERDVIDYYSKGLNNLKIQNIDDDFVISGQNSSNELIFVKGFYTDFSSMEGRSNGNPKWLWSNTIVLKIAMKQADILDFDYISEILNKGFNINSISTK